MNGLGTAYAKASPKIVLGYGGFALALSQPYTKRLNSYGDWARLNMSMTSNFNSDIDTYLPQL